MRLKTMVGAYVISTIPSSRMRFLTGVLWQFETVVFSDDEVTILHNGEICVAYAETEFSARNNHQLAVDWVRLNAGKDLRYVAPLILSQR